MKLLIIILNYRVADLTLDCLGSLAPLAAKIDGCRVVVVENGSQDGSRERLCRAIAGNGWDSWVELVALEENLGFTKGNNLIIRRAMNASQPPEYVLLLNADTLPHDPAICRLVQFMDDHPQCGIAGTRMDSPEGLPHGSPHRFHSLASEFDRGLGLGIVSRLLSRWAICLPKPAAASPVDWVQGACMIIRREVIESIGPLDEGYFAYFEDVDYCLSARRAGWPTWYVPDSQVVHIEGASSGIEPGLGVSRGARKRLPEYWFEARRRYFVKNHGRWYASAADAVFLAGCALGQLRRSLQGKRDPNPPHLLMDSVRHSVLFSRSQRSRRAAPSDGR